MGRPQKYKTDEERAAFKRKATRLRTQRWRMRQRGEPEQPVDLGDDMEVFFEDEVPTVRPEDKTGKS